MYSEKTTKFWEISTLLLSVCTADKSKVEILQNFVAFSEYMNFMNLRFHEFLKLFSYLKWNYECENDIKVFLHIYKIAISMKISTPCSYCDA